MCVECGFERRAKENVIDHVESNILQLNIDLSILAHYVLYISLPKIHLEHIKADIIENF